MSCKYFSRRSLCLALLLIPGLASAEAADPAQSAASYTITDLSNSLNVLGEQDIPALTEAATGGDATSQLLLGMAYLYEKGVPQDYQKSAAWLEKAAEQGEAIAQYQLGVNHQTGLGARADQKLAAKWFALAAAQGNVEAQFRLGTHYRLGEGLAQDNAQAAKWFNLAAEQGHAEAQWSLGLMYQSGNSVTEKDLNKARDFYAQAAEQGFPKAQYYLATMYEIGLGMAKDEVAAYKWHTLATAFGEVKALGIREKLALEMSKVQIAQGEQQADEWVASHTIPVVYKPALQHHE